VPGRGFYEVLANLFFGVYDPEVLTDIAGEPALTSAAPMEQPPRKLSGKRTAMLEHLESDAIERPPKGISR